MLQHCKTIQKKSIILFIWLDEIPQSVDYLLSINHVSNRMARLARYWTLGGATPRRAVNTST